MFLGEYQLKFSGKGRIVLPKQMRQQAGEKIILSRGFEGCIWGFSEEGFLKEANKQLEVSVTEERARMIRRYWFSGSVSAQLDVQGRFIIPAALLDYAKVGQQVVLIGAGDHFEIWNAKSWANHLEAVEKEYGKVSAE